MDWQVHQLNVETHVEKRQKMLFFFINYFLGLEGCHAIEGCRSDLVPSHCNQKGAMLLNNTFNSVRMNIRISKKKKDSRTGFTSVPRIEYVYRKATSGSRTSLMRHSMILERGPLFFRCHNCVTIPGFLVTVRILPHKVSVSCWRVGGKKSAAVLVITVTCSLHLNDSRCTFQPTLTFNQDPLLDSTVPSNYPLPPLQLHLQE